MSTAPSAAGPAIEVLRAGASWSRLLAVVTVLGSLLLAALPGPLSATGPAGLAVAGVGLLLGLPHGAIDHLLAARLLGWSAPAAAAAYAALAGASWFLLTAAPVVALVAVLALSVAHFGLGELEVVRETSDWRPPWPVAVAVAVAGTGALLLPLARSGPQLAGVAEAVSPALAAGLGEAAVRWSLALGWTLAAAVALVAAASARRPTVVLDVVLVGALGLLAPPLVAFALWFGCWHGLRHCARLLTLEPRCAEWVAAGERRRAVRTLSHLALWPTLAATATLAALLLATATATAPTAALAGTLVLLLALTVPHMVVVLLVDAGVARRAGRPEHGGPRAGRPVRGSGPGTTRTAPARLP